MAAKTLYIIDFDRTLLNVREVMDLAESVSNKQGIDFTAIRRASEETEGTGWSYSPLQAIKQADPSSFEKFKQEFINSADINKLLYEDGRRFLARLEEERKPFLILTFALDEKWQELKLQATGLDNKPHFITRNALKSKDISEWVDEKGNIAPPVAGIEPAEESWLIDDRSRVFEGLPANCKGFYMKRTDSADKGEVPEGTAVITSFDDIIDRI